MGGGGPARSGGVGGVTKGVGVGPRRGGEGQHDPGVWGGSLRVWVWGLDGGGSQIITVTPLANVPGGWGVGGSLRVWVCVGPSQGGSQLVTLTPLAKHNLGEGEITEGVGVGPESGVPLANLTLLMKHPPALKKAVER